jgi:hypothetical protein
MAGTFSGSFESLLFPRLSWFETREGALLTMRVWDLILRSIANGSRECAPDDRLRDASRRMKQPLDGATRYCMLTSVRSTNHDCGETKPLTLVLIARGLRSCTI